MIVIQQFYRMYTFVKKLPLSVCRAVCYQTEAKLLSQSLAKWPRVLMAVQTVPFAIILRDEFPRLLSVLESEMRDSYDPFLAQVLDDITINASHERPSAARTANPSSGDENLILESVIASIDKGDNLTLLFCLLLFSGDRRRTLVNSIDPKDGCQSRVLHIAVRRGSVDSVRLLLQLGADINALHGDSCPNPGSPLSEAINRQLADMVKFLLSWTCASRLEQPCPECNGRGACVADVWMRGRGYNQGTVLLNAINSTEMMQLLIDHHPNLVNSRDAGGKTPLHHAATSQKLPIVEMLLINGADVNAKDRNGITPFHKAYATREGWPGLVSRYPLDMTDSPSLKFRLDRNYDRRIGSAMVQMMIERGADVDALDYLNYTPECYGYAPPYARPWRSGMLDLSAARLRPRMAWTYMKL